MKQTLGCAFVLAFAVSAIAQEKEKTTVTTTTTTVKSGFDLLGGETFNVIDATPFETGAVDLRLSGRWVESGRTKDGGEDGVWTMQPTVVWGAAENLEVSFTVPFTHVDNFSDAPDGHYDTYFGLLWRLKEQENWWPAIALGSNLRIPTSEDSNGVDWELRLVLTNEWDGDIRSHFNIFGITVNHDNYADARDFQYGAVLGFDGPLCADGAVRWVADYMYRISDQDGNGGQNIGEAGFQWQINECNKIGFSVQLALDHAEETSNHGAALTYAYTIRN